MRSQTTGQYWLPSVNRAISWIDRVGVSTTRSAENGAGASPVPVRAPDSTTATIPVRSDDQTAAAPRSVSSTVASVVSWSGAVTSNPRSSRVAPSAVLETQYATRLPVPDTPPTNP